MKKIFYLIVFLAASSAMKGQQLLFDSLHKNEVTVNLTPVLILFSGGVPSTQWNWAFGYRHYFKNRWVLRTGFSFFPEHAANNVGMQVNYYRTVDLKNVFRQYQNNYSTRSQVGIGVEKLFHLRRLIHGMGGEVFAGVQKRRETDSYRWEYITAVPLQNQRADSTNHNVDSLGYSSLYSERGLGLNIFYSLRYQVSRFFYLSASIGPSFRYVLASGEKTDNRTKIKSRESYSYFEPLPIPLISEISFCFRF